MHSLIAAHLDAIRALCEEFGVARLEVFGSINTPAFDPDRSDVDFLVTYPDGYRYSPWLGRLHDLGSGPATVIGRDVDLVQATALQRDRFRSLANQTRQVVYLAPEIAALA